MNTFTLFNHKIFSKGAAILVGFALVMSFVPAANVASAATSGPNYPTAGANIQKTTGYANWTDTGMATSSDNNRAKLLNFVHDGYSNYLRVTGFGFAIPSGATINGITATIERQTSSGSDIRDDEIRLLTNASGAAATSTSNKATTTISWPENTDGTRTYGGTSDTWGSSWTPAQVNDPTFGLILSVKNYESTGNEDAYVDTVTMTITYTVTNATLTLVKLVTNDNGGTTATTTWTLSGDGPTDISGVSGSGAVTNAIVSPGTYNLSESGGPSGYSASSWVCTGTGTQDDGDTVSLDAGESATCTITNNDNAPSLTLVKAVTNDNGGDATEDEWTLTATGPTGFSGSGPSVSNGASFDAGTYDLSESGPTGYAASDWVCVGGTQNDGDTVTLALGESATCTITNNDIAPTLTLEKTVVTLDGGTATEADFQGKIDGSDVAWDTPITLSAGLHTASEVAGVLGYAASDWGGDCNPDGTITLAPGENATCTITNDDIAPGLTLQKIVTTDNGGNEEESDFQGYINDEPVDWDDAQTLSAGTYTLSESGPDGYEASGWSCEGGSLVGDDITIAEGETVVCTITNDDIAPTITLTKNVINDNGGTAEENDFGLSIGGTPVDSEQTLPVDANVPIELVELSLTGYSFVSITGDEGCPSEVGGTVTLNEGEDITCTITNDDDAPSLTLIKYVDNEEGGEANPSDWVLTATGDQEGEPTIISGEGGASSEGDFQAGTYTLSESDGPENYVEGDWSCEGGLQEGNTITLDIGESATCWITNTYNEAPPPPELTVKKVVINDNEGTGTADDFFFQVNGGEETPFIQDENPLLGEQNLILSPGTYTITEITASGYTTTYENCSGLELAPGDTEICTITNNDIAPPPPTPPSQPPAGNGPPVGSGGIGVGGQVLGASTGPGGEGSTGEGSVLGASTCSTPLLTKYMKEGRPNDPEQVKLLQQFLNDEMGSNLQITGFFGPLTTAAVKAFQLKYASEILAPWVPHGLPSAQTPTGYVYKTTLRWINKLYCESLDIPMPQLP